MADFLFSCGALLSTRLKKKYNSRKEHKKEYALRFEEFKAENQRWETRRQSFPGYSHTINSTRPPSHADPVTDSVVDATPAAVNRSMSEPTHEPPSYDSPLASPSAESSSGETWRSDSSGMSASTSLTEERPRSDDGTSSSQRPGRHRSRYIAIATRDMGSD